MKLYDFYIFNKSGRCIFHAQWDANKEVRDLEESKKLVFGMTFSLRNLCGKLAPDGSENLEVMRTNNFAIHHFMSATGLVFILSSDPACPNQHNRLKAVYANLFTEYVSKNPLFESSHSDLIKSPMFKAKLEELLGLHE
jgi:trafficking protein particle complex subunit 1